MNKWWQYKVNEMIKELEWEADLRYDCVMQIISEEFGNNVMQDIHRRAGERYVTISSSTEAATQSEDSQAKSKGQLLPGDD